MKNIEGVKRKHEMKKVNVRLMGDEDSARKSIILFLF